MDVYRQCLLLLIVSVCTFTCAVDVKPCCGPTKWTANIVQTIGEYNRDLDAASVGYGNTTIYYDYDNKQMAFKQILLNRTDHDRITHKWIIFKYNLGKRFVIMNQTCTSSTIREEMEKPCIPDDAAFLGSHAYPGNLKVNVWLIENKNIGGARRLSVTEKMCMRTTMARITGGPDYILDTGIYQNVTSGISDPSVFVVPSFCGSSYQALKFVSMRQRL